MTAELKPCPFCGGLDDLLIRHTEGTVIKPHFYVECDNCGGQAGGSDLGVHVRNWNTRAAAAAPSGEQAVGDEDEDQYADVHVPEEMMERARQRAMAVVDHAQQLTAVRAELADKDAESAVKQDAIQVLVDQCREKDAEIERLRVESYQPLTTALFDLWYEAVSGEDHKALTIEKAAQVLNEAGPKIPVSKVAPDSRDTLLATMAQALRELLADIKCKLPIKEWEAVCAAIAAYDEHTKGSKAALRHRTTPDASDAKGEGS